MNILIVDDRRENLLALEAVLKSPDYHLIFASSGEEALKCLLKSDFAVILLDVQMPGMDGFETARLIRTRKKNKNTPIIFITAIYQTNENMLQGYSLGAIDYLFKPFNPETLKLKIEAFVKIYLNEKQIRLQNDLLTLRAVELEKVNESLERTTSDLRKSEALARVFGETCTDTIITLNGVGRILNVNPAGTEMFGYEHAELQRQHVSKLFPNESLLFPKNAQVISKRCKILDAAAAHKDGTVFPVEVQIGVATIEEQQIFVWSVRNITERKQLEKERKERYQTLEELVLERTCELFQANENLSETSLKLTNILESITDVFFFLDQHWQFTFVNEEAEKFWLKEREELIGRNIWDLFPETLPRYYSHYQKAMLTKQAAHFEIMGLYSNNMYEVFVYPSKEGLSVCYRDISKRKMLEKEMAHLSRLNLVGQMAAGIAHEIRNPMTTIRGYLQLLGAKSEFLSYGSTFELMIEELDRANSIISEFLSLTQKRKTDMNWQNINTILHHLYPLLEADAFTQNKQIMLEAGETPDILFDDKEISQLVLNLCRNGLEAMQVGGNLTIRTYVEDEQVVFSVEDEGGGIPSESLDKLGTPFFTTKEDGTGLGLATCYSIADRHNAKIDLKSDPKGTAFFVRFPCLAVNQL
ncbi:MAG: PAS domain S-box protein [Desulfosporosinus sp.]|nr:PAS domain S-box protein [Desulfosporosinus sp.]